MEQTVLGTVGIACLTLTVTLLLKIALPRLQRSRVRRPELARRLPR